MTKLAPGPITTLPLDCQHLCGGGPGASGAAAATATTGRPATYAPAPPTERNGGRGLQARRGAGWLKGGGAQAEVGLGRAADTVAAPPAGLPLACRVGPQGSEGSNRLFGGRGNGSLAVVGGNDKMAKWWGCKRRVGGKRGRLRAGRGHGQGRRRGQRRLAV